MKRIFIFLTVLVLLNSCISLLNQRASWKFLETGEFTIGNPYKNKNEYFLPFEINLKKGNSAPLDIKRARVRVRGNEISFYLIYGLSENNNINNIKLGKLTKGTYNIFYDDKEIGKIFINEIIIQ
jgi:hypothetical protein